MDIYIFFNLSEKCNMSETIKVKMLNKVAENESAY